MPNPLVSIIITYFNYSDFLPAAIASVREQTYPDIELIVVDDCAANGTPTAEQLLGNGFTGTVVRHDKNLGLPAARNTGVAKSTGELLVVMDSDDILKPTFVEKTVRTLCDSGSDGVYTQVQTFGDRDYLWTPDCSLCSLLGGNPGPTTFLMRRDVFDKTGGYKVHLPLHSDHDFWISAVSKGFRFVRLEEPLFHYRKHAQSLSAVHISERWSAVPTLYDEHKDLYHSNLKELLTLREKQYRQLEFEYDKLWQEWHRVDLESRFVHQQYESAEGHIRFANSILQNPILRGTFSIYRKLRGATGKSR